MEKNAFALVTGSKLTLRLIGFYPAEGEALPFYWWDILLPSGKAVGKISLRLGHNRHSYYNGNIGYEIDAPHRGHHYALTSCRMVLPIARQHGMDRLYLTCEADNAASYKTIEGLGAKLVETVTPPEDYLYYFEGIREHRIYELILFTE